MQPSTCLSNVHRHPGLTHGAVPGYPNLAKENPYALPFEVGHPFFASRNMGLQQLIIAHHRKPQSILMLKPWVSDGFRFRFSHQSIRHQDKLSCLDFHGGMEDPRAKSVENVIGLGGFKGVGNMNFTSKSMVFTRENVDFITEDRDFTEENWICPVKMWI